MLNFNMPLNSFYPGILIFTRTVHSCCPYLLCCVNYHYHKELLKGSGKKMCNKLSDTINEWSVWELIRLCVICDEG